MNLLFNLQSELNVIDDIYIFQQVAGKREPEQEAEAQQWVESVIGERFPPGKFSMI